MTNAETVKLREKMTPFTLIELHEVLDEVAREMEYSYDSSRRITSELHLNIHRSALLLVNELRLEDMTRLNAKIDHLDHMWVTMQNLAFRAEYGR